MENRDRTSGAQIHILSWPLLAIVVTVLCPVVGCGKEPTNAPVAQPSTTGNKKNTAVTGGSSTVTASDLDDIKKAGQPYKILLIVKTLNNPFFKPMVSAFKQAAAELGVHGDVQAAPQETDVDKQAALVQNAAAQGYKAICITPADSKALVPALKSAADKGVLIINVDNRLDKDAVNAAGLDLGGYVGADNEQGGKLAGQAMDLALEGKGNVVVIEGIRGVDNAEARKRGFETAVKGKLTILDERPADWTTEKAQNVMINLLALHPDIHGVFCANDEMAIGAIKAIKAYRPPGHISVVSYDNIKEVRPYLKSHELYATIEQHPDLMGAESLRLAVAVLDGKAAKGNDLLVSLETITK